MNIFALHANPRLSARFLCNFHVVKMLAESAEMMLLTHYHFRSPDKTFPMSGIPLRMQHMNHPYTMWARQSANNYRWLQSHADELCQEYWKRYGQWRGVTHDYQWEIQGWLASPPGELKLREEKFGVSYVSSPAGAFGDFKREASRILDHDPDMPVSKLYRLYYIWKEESVKKPMVWPDGPPPWFTSDDASITMADYMWADMPELLDINHSMEL